MMCNTKIDTVKNNLNKSTKMEDLAIFFGISETQVSTKKTNNTKKKKKAGADSCKDETRVPLRQDIYRYVFQAHSIILGFSCRVAGGLTKR